MDLCDVWIFKLLKPQDYNYIFNPFLESISYPLFSVSTKADSYP